MHASVVRQYLYVKDRNGVEEEVKIVTAARQAAAGRRRGGGSSNVLALFSLLGGCCCCCTRFFSSWSDARGLSAYTRVVRSVGREEDRPPQ